MDGIISEIRQAAVVAIGGFNPAILSPEWFRSHDLLPSNEVDEALEGNQVIVSSRLTQWSTEWLSIQALPERLAVSIRYEAKAPFLKDLAVGILRLLPETPVTAIGLNHMAHLPTVDGTAAERLSHRVNITGWSASLPEAKIAQLIFRGARSDERPGQITVRVEPSIQIPDGLLVDINDHYDLREDSDATTTSRALDVLINEWIPSEQQAHSLFEAISRD